MEKGRCEEAKRSGALHADDGGGGDATPVVFLHSTAGNADQWSAQLGHLRSRRRAVALEWRGHGRTGVSADGDYSITTAAREVFEAVEGLGLGRFVLVGHSGGALVALQCAADHPERVEGLLLVDPAGDLGRVPAEMAEPFLSGIQSEAYPAAIEEYWRSILTGSEPSVRERVLADLRDMPRESVMGFFLAARQYDPIPVLKTYRGTVLAVITPSNDAPFSLHNFHPGLSHARFEGTGHWLHMDKPKEFNRLLDDFIVEIEKDARVQTRQRPALSRGRTASNGLVATKGEKMLRGMATVNYWADDLEVAKEWYAKFLGIDPYFERPGYYEFRVGDHEHELGLIDARYAPNGHGAGPAGAVLHWHVDDVRAALERLLSMGAEEHQPVTEWGTAGFVTASVVDPFGNVLGIMHNPHYVEVLGRR